MRSRVSLVLFSVLLASCDSEPEVQDGNKQMQIPVLEFAGESVSIPIRFLYGRPVIDVKVNGQGPFTLVLDTGATSVSLERNVVKHLQLSDCGTTTRTNSASEKFERRLFGVDRFEVGDAVLGKVAVCESDFFSKQGMSGIHGIWGMCHFGKRIVIVDSLRNVLHIRQQQAESVEGIPWLPLRIDVFTPEVPIQIGGKAYHFLIDTGGDESLSVAASVASELPCYEKRFRERSGAAGDMGSISYMWTISTRLREDILLGCHSVEQPYVSWCEDRRGRNLIGMEILRSFAIELDLKENRVRFLRDETSPLSFPDRRRLGILIAHNLQDNSSVISHINPYRTGMDDVKVGDCVLAIDGHSMSSITGNLLQELIRTKKTLAFTVQRNGESITIDFDVHQDSFGLAP